MVEDKPTGTYSCHLVQHNGQTYRAYDIGGFTVFHTDTKCFTFPWGKDNRVCASRTNTTLFLCAYPFFQPDHYDLARRQVFTLLKEVAPILRAFKQQHPDAYANQLNS